MAWRRLRTANDTAARVAAAAGYFDVLPATSPAVIVAGNQVLADVTGAYTGRVPESAAMRVAPFARGVRLISQVAASAPLRVDGATPRAMQAGGMHPTLSDHALMAATYRSLILTGRAGWVIRPHSTAGADVWRVDPDRLQRVDGPNWSPDVAGWRVDGLARGDELIVFDTGAAGALSDGAGVLSAALHLEATAARIARTPTPTVVLEGDGIDLTETEATEVVARWETQRRAHSTAYLDGRIKARTLDWSAADIQLAEARTAIALQCAQLLNLDPSYLGIGVAGSSLTYANRTDLNTALLELSVMPLVRVIEGTLSRVWGRHVAADFTGFTRADLAARVAALVAYVDAGIMTPDEARRAEPLIETATERLT